MLNRAQLKDAIHQRGLSQRDQLLLVLACGVERAKPTSEVKSLAIESGLKKAKNWNVGAIFSGSKDVCQVKDGWELTLSGRTKTRTLIANSAVESIETVHTAKKLRQQLAKIQSTETRQFVEEAVKCYECGCYRAAVVLSWLGAVSVIQDHVLKNELKAFNADMVTRFTGAKPIKKKDDFSERLQETEFLTTLKSSDIIDKNIKKELDVCLGLRNSCGHPNTLVVDEHRVTSHLEILINNVFLRFC